MNITQQLEEYKTRISNKENNVQLIHSLNQLFKDPVFSRQFPEYSRVFIHPCGNICLKDSVGNVERAVSCMSDFKTYAYGQKLVELIDERLKYSNTTSNPIMVGY